MSPLQFPTPGEASVRGRRPSSAAPGPVASGRPSSQRRDDPEHLARVAAHAARVAREMPPEPLPLGLVAGGKPFGRLLLGRWVRYRLDLAGGWWWSPRGRGQVWRGPFLSRDLAKEDGRRELREREGVA